MPLTAPARRRINTNTNNAPGHVAGAVARLLEADPNLSPDQLRGQILATATNGTITGLRGTPNLLLYTGGFAPACPAYGDQGERRSSSSSFNCKGLPDCLRLQRSQD